MSDKIVVTIDGRKYEWMGGLGSIIRSYERGVKQGDVRIIDDMLFYAYRVGAWFITGRNISWTIQNVTVEKVREIKERLLT